MASASPGWVDACERRYAAEGDLRGHDATLGWLQPWRTGPTYWATLGLHSDVAPRRMLDLAARRMLGPATPVWRDQEDDRLAHALGKVLTRPGLSRTTRRRGWTPLPRSWPAVSRAPRRPTCRTPSARCACSTCWSAAASGRARTRWRR
ncbi:MAG: DUF2785 domain-containing protein [Frankiaceae bacterium]